MANDIWVEKYRPKEFSEVKGQPHIVQKIKAFVKWRGTRKKRSVSSANNKSIKSPAVGISGI